jgi:hypothetical protein
MYINHETSRASLAIGPLSGRVGHGAFFYRSNKESFIDTAWELSNGPIILK